MAGSSTQYIGFVPGQVDTVKGDIELNVGRETVSVKVENLGDRPVQIGSHYHFFEVNNALSFDRELTRGFRLNIPAGTATRFEPGSLARLSWWLLQVNVKSTVSKAKSWERFNV